MAQAPVTLHPDRYLSVSETAEYSGFSAYEVRALVRSRELACVRRRTPTGGRGHIKIRQSEIDRYMKKNTIPAARSAS